MLVFLKQDKRHVVMKRGSYVDRGKIGGNICVDGGSRTLRPLRTLNTNACALFNRYNISCVMFISIVRCGGDTADERTQIMQCVDHLACHESYPSLQILISGVVHLIHT